MKHKDQCRRGLHDFETKLNEGDRVTSKCSICGKVITENAKDNRTYLKNHKRDFLQRGSKEYKWIYGENPIFEKKPDEAWEETGKKDHVMIEFIGGKVKRHGKH